MRNALLAVGLVLSLAVPNVAIVQKERLLASGQTVLLELAPVDPRSLIQGDYMRLRYAMTRAIETAHAWPRDGHIVVILDRDGVAQFVRRHTDDQPLGAGELLLQYRKRGGSVRVSTDAYYFQEGTARRFERARYGELRVDDKGGSVLVGLRDSARVALR